jgi:neutral ceramidase
VKKTVRHKKAEAVPRAAVDADVLLVGAAEVDITPPIGTPLCGSIWPRRSKGILDPLTVKAVVLQSGGQRLAYVLFDLEGLPRKEGDAAVALASARTGIPQQNIVWAASHTHSGPYVQPMFGPVPGVVDEKWLAGIPGKFADAVEAASKCMRTATMSLSRAYCLNVGHNRRLRYKDGREINTCNLESEVGDGSSKDVQCLGSGGPVDPEIGMLCFDDERGTPIAVLWHFTLHTSTDFGKYFTADYPAVVAARLRERLGPGLVSIFVPGACGNISYHVASAHRVVGDALAEAMIPELEKRKPRMKRVKLASLKEDIVVPCRDFDADQEARIQASGWAEDIKEVFREELKIVREQGEKEVRTVLQAWRIGDVGFVSLPGEVFVEWGLKIKEESPFPWTFPVELGGDYIGYMVTPQAWKTGAYESLLARTAKPSVEGVEMMVARAQKLLGRLWQ